ncbi:uncharacterized protein FPRN_15031 [Fusarium proliferatum]|nr:uncharacterized protein FPRN_15031 [Fusarium proliferatum]
MTKPSDNHEEIIQQYRLKLPGWDLPLDTYDANINFEGNDAGHGDPWIWTRRIPELPERSIYDDTKSFWLTRRTVLENYIIGVVNAITNKPDWTKKLKRLEIRNRWKQEIRGALIQAVQESSKLELDRYVKDNYHEELEPTRQAVVERAVDFCMEELDHKAKQTLKNGYTTILGLGNADIVKSDTAVPNLLNQRLQSLARRLEDSQATISWQPGQEGIVRNLIHPSKHPLQYGRSKIATSRVPLRDAFAYSNCGQTIPLPSKQTRLYSSRFQWLPAEVQFTSTGQAQFTSVINGLDYEEHPELYSALAELIDHCVPLWNQCLPLARGNNPRRCPCNYEDDCWTAPSTVTEECEDQSSLAYYSASPPYWMRDADEATKERWRYRFPSCPPPMAFQQFANLIDETPKVDLRRVYQSVQVIVKMSNVILTPERPKSKEVAWHVEGLANEHICATAIYYYEFDNVASSHVYFRTPAAMGEMSYGQMQYRGLRRVFGTELTDVPAIQQLPMATNVEGRLFVFPNVFQHKVPPLKLQDPSRPGHRKFIVLWLVNPQKRIISTANVGPQQKEAAVDRLAGILRGIQLPATIVDRIIRESYADLPSADDMQQIQKELMDERIGRGADYSKIEREYNFCEH